MVLNPYFVLVLSIAVFETVDEAVSLANASDYSLSASVFSADVWAARKVASRMRSGKYIVSPCQSCDRSIFRSISYPKDTPTLMARPFTQNPLMVLLDWGKPPARCMIS